MKDRLSEIIIAISEKDDHYAFNELFRYFFPGMISYSKSIVGDCDAAADLVQDIFFTIWQNRKTLTSINSISNYLYTSLKYNSIRWVEKNKLDVNLNVENLEIFSLSNPETKLISKEDVCKIEEAINSLPNRCRLIFRLIKEDGMKYKDVANLLDISVKTVESHMTLAYGRIVECIEEIMPGLSNQFISKRKKIF